ncbi:hypothetical protein AAKU64_004617 [Undibacterium sp. GrIS 1.8]|uniref:hypothetical protein n=1 Tax=unclassified Undibacterium TaxID=2630295 RepID=UPI00339B2974
MSNAVVVTVAVIWVGLRLPGLAGVCLALLRVTARLTVRVTGVALFGSADPGWLGVWLGWPGFGVFLGTAGISRVYF